MAEVMLTTVDNPYDPFTQFNEWYAYDTVQKDYNTCAYLARVAPYTPDMAPDVAEALVEKAIDEIVSINVLGIYKKVKRNERATNQKNGS